MTALLYYLAPQEVCIAMDTCTLLIEPTGDRVFGPFCSKILVLPHMHLAVCGTGIRSLLYYWNAFLQQNAVARDILELDNVARETLPRLAAECQVTQEHTSTIYHFGFSPERGEMAGTAYRSANGFEGDELDFSLGIKPPDNIDLDRAQSLCAELGLPAGFVEVMKLQKAQDDLKPMHERLGIGGEVQFLHLTPAGFNLQTCHRFEDFDEQFSKILESFRPPESSDDENE